MEPNEKNEPISSTPYLAPAPNAGYQGHPPVQYPPVAAYYPPPYYAAAPPPLAYQPQQITSGVIIVGSTPPTQTNVAAVVQTVRTNVQIPTVYPGLAFCRFAPGILETIIRSSIVVMLLVLIGVAAATINKSVKIFIHGSDSPYGYRYYNYGMYVNYTEWRAAAGWIILVAGASLITEGIILLLRLLNPKCFNNSYRVFGGLDITKCVLSGISLLIGCIVTGVETAILDEDIDAYCDSSFRNPDNNAGCERLATLRRLVITLTAINAVCVVLILILFVWDIVYLSAGLNSKIPVPRGTAGQQQQ